MTRFKLFSGTSPAEIEAEMNAWAESLPPGSKVRRTQLAAAAPPDAPAVFNLAVHVYVLVSYEPAPGAGPPKRAKRCAHCTDTETIDGVEYCTLCGWFVTPR